MGSKSPVLMDVIQYYVNLKRHCICITFHFQVYLHIASLCNESRNSSSAHMTIKEIIRFIT